MQSLIREYQARRGKAHYFGILGAKHSASECRGRDILISIGL